MMLKTIVIPSSQQLMRSNVDQGRPSERMTECAYLSVDSCRGDLAKGGALNTVLDCMAVGQWMWHAGGASIGDIRGLSDVSAHCIFVTVDLRTLGTSSVSHGKLYADRNVQYIVERMSETR